MDAIPYVLLWCSANEAVHRQYGEYPDVPTAAADLDNAKAWLRAEAETDRDLRDIEQGQWRIIPRPKEWPSERQRQRGQSKGVTTNET